MGYGRVTVYSGDIMRPPLLDSAEANMIVIRDEDGSPMALFVRILSENIWGFSTRGDPDWGEMLMRYGLSRRIDEEEYKTLTAERQDLKE